MSKRAAEDGIGQLTFTFFLPQEEKDGAGETQHNGPGASQTAVAAGSKPERKRKWHSLIDKVYSLPNLRSAWQKVEANGGAPGVDRITIARFGEDAHSRIERLHEDLRKKTYRPQPVRRVYIPKSGGGKRPLGVPTVRDRIVQQALLQVLSPIFERKFSNRSHGFRPQRGCATALDVVDRAVRHGYTWVVDADICSFFDTVNHEKLIDAVAEEVADGSVLRLIRRILTAGVVQPRATEVEATELGTPQGGPVSPLLANIYLHRLDVQMKEAGYGLVRYADDFVVLAKSKGEAEQALSLARQVLEGKLGLTLHPEKTRVVSVAEGFEFLGFHYFRDPKTDRMVKEVRQKSVQRFREAVRQKTPRLKTGRKVKARNVTPHRLAENQRVGEMIASLNRFLRGWHWYFKALWSRYPQTPFRNFDGYVRARLRSAVTGRVGPGWWNQRLSNGVIRGLGLVPLDEWQQLYQTGRLKAPVLTD